MKALLYFTVLISSVLALNLTEVYTPEELESIDESVLEDARLNFENLTKKYGYPAETHHAVTSDGYILQIHRIPYGKKCGPSNTTKTPVLLMHGLLSHSIDWNLMGPEKGLGYILADECYDVWLGNARGTAESKRHVALDVKSREFWNFSWHEIGIKDLPAIIDYILGHTGQPDLHYIGHSQGTTAFFVFASLLPEHSSKVRAAYALAPVAYMKHAKSPILKIMTLFQNQLEFLTHLFGLNELLTTSEFLNEIGSEVCHEKYGKLKSVCVNAVFLLTGYDIEQLNMTMLPVIAGHSPAGASVKQVLHFGQCHQSNDFRQYSYGPFTNAMKYGSIIPPRYPLENIKIPTAIFYSDNDWLAEVTDVNRLADSLPSLIGKYRVPRKQFNHLGFIWAVDVKPLLYNKLITLMKMY